ncbi:queuosine precursor transporter [Helicobacter sp. MIT 14-3879]|uniref:queuosine precursor transporter n=1 Tax=Helicobacter sp. MIT 14-3879 TaxID=2040649 RepID=UPI000E1F06C1|nr:queuosine precursor transporter [Helicobacter sp. MIT 14-3879]RDU62674.1 hypothetical protein CQA44_06720 [Helicobacter sp. MIT 14-3879]
MQLKFIIYAIVFSLIVVLSNYAVQFSIAGTYLTYGALSYPFSFLFLDILSEKNNRKDVLKVLSLGITIAFIPSLLLSEPLIAIASICAFMISQPLDVFLFYFFKKRLPRLWWLRNNASTIIAQFFDTMIFFNIAFLFEKSFEEVLIMALFDFSIKVLLSIIDTPFFYIFAIRIKNRIFA